MHSFQLMVHHHHHHHHYPPILYTSRATCLLPTHPSFRYHIPPTQYQKLNPTSHVSHPYHLHVISYHITSRIAITSNHSNHHLTSSTILVTQCRSISHHSIHQIGRRRCHHQAYRSRKSHSRWRSSNHSSRTPQTREITPAARFQSPHQWTRKTWLVINRRASAQIQCEYVGSRILRQTVCKHQRGTYSSASVCIHN